MYDRIKRLLELNPIYRNSDKELFWQIFTDLGIVVDGVIDKYRFIEAPAFESMRRSRQKVQEQYPELQASKVVKEIRKKNMESWGKKTYLEETPLSLSEVEAEMKDLIVKWKDKKIEAGHPDYMQFRSDKLKYHKLRDERVYLMTKDIFK